MWIDRRIREVARGNISSSSCREIHSSADELMLLDKSTCLVCNSQVKQNDTSDDTTNLPFQYPHHTSFTSGAPTGVVLFSDCQDTNTGDFKQKAYFFGICTA